MVLALRIYFGICWLYNSWALFSIFAVFYGFSGENIEQSLLEFEFCVVCSLDADIIAVAAAPEEFWAA